jgi:hypothetical protein
MKIKETNSKKLSENFSEQRHPSELDVDSVVEDGSISPAILNLKLFNKHLILNKNNFVMRGLA